MMKILIQFELKKLFLRRSTQFSLIALIGLSILFGISTYQNKYAFDGIAHEGTGHVAIEIEQQMAQKYSGLLTDEKIQQIMRTFKPTYDLHGLNAKYLYQNSFQSATFARFSDLEGNWNGQSVSDVFGEEPIQIGYIEGWLSTNHYMIKVLTALLFVLILILSSVFCGEYSGVDNIILTSQFGRTKCITAKIIASILTSLSITAFILIFNYVLAFYLYGSEGLHCSILFAPVEFTEIYIPFNITCGTLILYQILLAFTAAISITGITLALSACCNNQIVALALSSVLYILPIMLPIAETNPLFKLIVLLPFYQTHFISIMSTEQFANGLLYAIWAIPVAIFLIGIGAILSRYIFAKHQVC